MHKKPSITAGKGLVGVERSKGWVMLEGPSTPRGQIRPVPKWDETRVGHRFHPPELDLWVSSLLLLTIYPEKKAESKWPRRNPSAALNPSFWLIALSATSSLLIHTHCTASLICQSEKVAPWHTLLVLPRFLVNISHQVGGDKWPPEHWPCRDYWQEETMAESKVPEVQFLSCVSHSAIKNITVTAT